VAARLRRGEDPADPDWEAVWIGSTPAEMAARILAGFPERFAWTLDDLRGVQTPRPVVADGWGLRPELVAEVTPDLRRMVVLVPTAEWRLHQAAALPRSAGGHRLSDPALVLRNRIERDRLVAEDAVRRARDLGILVIHVDGSRPADAIADDVAAHFAPFLP
jgi:hypothetical protein